MESSQQYKLGMLLALIVTLLASAGWVFTKIALREIEPIAFIAWRFLFAGLIFLPFCYSQLLSFTKSQWRRALMLGCAMAVAICVWIEGMYRTAHIGEAAFIVSLMVVIIPLISTFFGHALKKYLIICLVPAVCGLYFLTGANGFAFEPAQLILLLSAILFSLHVVLSTEYTKEIPVVSLTCVQLLVAAVFAAVLSASKGSLTLIFVEDWSNLTWIMLLCSAFIATSLRFGLQTKALSLIPASETGMIFSLGPVWTATLGWLILQEQMTWLQLLGCGLIFSAQLLYRIFQRADAQSKKQSKMA